MRLRKMFLAIFAVCLPLHPGIVRAQNPHPAPPAHPIAPMIDQEVLLLFAGRSADDKILLTLNNNRPGNLAVDLTLYDLEGNPKQLPSLTMDPSESRLIEFGSTLRALNLMAPLGFLKVHYSGRSMELGAQLTLYPVQNRGGLDSPRSLSVDFASTERHALAWTPPGSDATFAITNIAPSSIAAKLTISGKAEIVQIKPNETFVRRREAAEAGLSSLIDLDVSFAGPKDALRVFGYIASRDEGTLPIRVYDPKAATTQVLSSVGLETGDETHASVRNLSDKPVFVIPLLTPIGTDVPKTVTGLPLLVPPLSSLEIPLASYLKVLNSQGVQRATLFLRNHAPIGQLIAALDQRIAPGLLEDIPFRTANPPRYMRGFYPLRWDTDYTNTPMIANTSDQKATVSAYVIAGGVTYTFPNTPVSPGATALFDVDAIRAAQTPDASGKRIPKSALYGKFHWTTLPGNDSQEGLHGRTELKSLQALRASSFSCGGDCPYQTWSFPYFDTDPFNPYPEPYLQDARETTLHDYYRDTYGNVSNRSMTTGSMYPDGIDDTSILGMSSINNDLTLRMDTGNPGTTYLHYYFTNNYTYISSTDDGNPNACTVDPEGSTNGSNIDVAPCPTGISITGITSRMLPDADDPTYNTGVGILTLMTLNPLSTSFAGLHIDEVVSPTAGSNTCPASIQDATNFPSVGAGSPGFTVGMSAMWEGQGFNSVTNSFYDSHRARSYSDVLGGTGVNQCSAKASQVYYCRGVPVATSILTNTYAHSTLNGHGVTNVTTTKE